MSRKFKQGNTVSLITGKSAGTSVKDIPTDETLLFNFKHLDRQQGQMFEHWEKNEMLARMLWRFHGHSSTPMRSIFNDKFKIYGSFPAKSDFTHPAHVPPDAQWASMHIQGKECVCGHILKNIFYVVFLDCEHRFYISELKNT